ncbi:MAG TPA: FAD-binding protein [Pseudonocardia sp.]|nr:FAD-binding protein [Pseudonocardia sp.]
MTSAQTPSQSPSQASAPVVRPTNLAEAAEALTGGDGRVEIRGAATARDWAGRPEPADLVLDTTAMTGVITHNPGDMTVSVRAGTPLRVLNDELASHGQRVALDAARVDAGATVGGLVATADAGPSALVHGSLRDLVIGTTVVLADGTPARSGGHVIKNVAGYDLSKLLHGAYGTLALIAEVVLRLHPVPAAETTVRLVCPLGDAAAAARAVLGSPLEPVALEWADGALLTRLAGNPTTVTARAQRLATLLGPSAEPLDTGTAATVWQRHRELVSGPPGEAAMLRIGTRPSRLPEVLAALVALGGSRVTAGLGTGVATLALPADPGTLEQAHRLVYRAGGSSMLRSRPPGSDAPAWGPPPSAVAVLRAVRRELDPRGRLGAGRFSPWM